MFCRIAVFVSILFFSSLPARADCKSDIDALNDLVVKYNAIEDRGYCDRAGVIQSDIIPLLDELDKYTRKVEGCPLVKRGTSRAELAQKLTKFKEFVKQCTAKHEQDAANQRLSRRSINSARQGTSRASYFDCGRKPQAGGAAWDLECLQSNRSAATRFAPAINPQDLSRRATEACRTADGDQKAACILRAKVRILMTEVPSIARACGDQSGDALTNCADSAYLGSVDMEAVRSRVANSLRNAKISVPASPNSVGARTSPLAAESAVPPAAEPSTTTASTVAKDNIYCSFVTYAIRRRDLAYSRADQIPAECRSLPEVRQAFETSQRIKPAFPIAGVTTDTEIAKLKKGIDAIGDRATLREQLPPAGP